MNKQIVGAKKVAEEQSKPYKDRVARLERDLKDFVTEHRADMGKVKTKALTFGEVSFRLSTAISLPRAKDKIEEIVRRLKARKMTDCIVTKEEISKDALKKYGETPSTRSGPPGRKPTFSATSSTSPGSSRSRAGSKGARASCGST